MIGDLLFYRSSGRWWERLICAATRGPYTHVAIMSDRFGQVIAARARGIVYEPVPPLPGARYTMLSLTEEAPEYKRLAAMEWAEGCIGDGYGWLDLLAAGMKSLWPQDPLRFGLAAHYDCSDFAARYLLHAGILLPDTMLDTASVSPNDLARWFDLPM